MNMTPNVAEAIRALTEKPMLATTAERFLILDEIKSAHKELSHPLRFSWMLSHLLSRVSVPLAPYDLIAGRTVDRLLTEEEAVRFHDFVHHEDFPDGKSFLSSGHMTYSWEAVIELGIPGLRKMAESQLAVATDSEARDYIQATIEIHDAVIAYMLRYADAAEEAGLLSVSKNLRMGTRRAPVHFAEALQLLWIITLIDCAYVTENPTLTLGRLDQILYPLYQKDLADRVITEEEARAYITDYYCKHNLIMGRGEHQVGDAQNSTTFCRILNFDAPQYLLLAGVDAEGNAALNPLTELFAECIVPSFKNPVVVVRYVRGMDKTAPSLWKTLIDKAIASASMMFYNDKNVMTRGAEWGFPRRTPAAHIPPFLRTFDPPTAYARADLQLC